MMRSIFYYIIFYLLVSAVGMYVANRKVSPEVKRQRWLKFFTYMLITSIVTAAIFVGKLLSLAIIICIASAYELAKIKTRFAKKKYKLIVFTWLLFAAIVAGFLGFSGSFIPAFQLFIYFQVFTFDALCQITGQLFGRHMLSAKISPAKTVEGFIGGVLFCILSSCLGSSWVNISLSTAVLVGLITAMTSFAGDMLASYFKRLLRIKDYSKLLPGQGGFLDRFDSLMMTGAVYYFLFISFVKLQSLYPFMIRLD